MEPIQDRDPGDEDPDHEEGSVGTSRNLDSVEEAYDLHDPKGPRYYSTHADIWDNREKCQ